MTALKQLFLNSINEDGQNYHYKSPDFDLSFISFQQKIYFILAKGDETCLSGTIGKINNELSFDFNKNSTWLKNNISQGAALELMEEKYSFMQPLKSKGLRI